MMVLFFIPSPGAAALEGKLPILRHHSHIGAFSLGPCPPGGDAEDYHGSGLGNGIRTRPRAKKTRLVRQDF